MASACRQHSLPAQPQLPLSNGGAAQFPTAVKIMGMVGTWAGMLQVGTIQVGMMQVGQYRWR